MPHKARATLTGCCLLANCLLIVCFVDTATAMLTATSASTATAMLKCDRLLLRWHAQHARSVAYFQASYEFIVALLPATNRCACAPSASPLAMP